MNIWLHARNTPHTCILIMSPDNDVYNIGLSLSSMKNKQVVIQVSTYNARELNYLHLNNLISALSNDPDLARIEPTLLPQILQIIYNNFVLDVITYLFLVRLARQPLCGTFTSMLLSSQKEVKHTQEH